MNITRVELMPDVWLTTIQTNRFKSSYWSIQLLTPMEEETASLNAVLPYVLRRGTSRYPDMTALAEALDDLYGGSVEPTVHKIGDVQAVGLEGYFLDDAYVPDGKSIYRRIAELMGSLLLHPATKNGRLRQDYITGEKNNLIHRIQSLENDKRTYAGMRLLSEMYPKHPYGISKYGTVARAKKVSQIRLVEHYHNVVQMAPIEICYCGSVDAGQVELAWKEALMGLPRGAERYQLHTEYKRHSTDPLKEVFEEQDVSQGRLEMGFTLGVSVGDAMYPAVLVANALYGGAAGSRLFVHVREKKSLCYYAGSSLAGAKGMMTVSCGVAPECYDEAKAEILAQLEDLQQGNFSDEEFQAAKNYVISNLTTRMDEISRLCGFWLRDVVATEHYDPEHMIGRVRKVTRGQVKAALMEITPDTSFYLSRPMEKEAEPDAGV